MENVLMTRCDVLFMISGRRDTKNEIRTYESENASNYINAMLKTIDIEINEKDVSACERYNLGDLKLLFKHDPDMPRKDDVIFDAFATLCYHHESKLCVLEIYVHDCNDGVQILECERNDEMYVEVDGKYISEKEYLSMLEITPHGLKRSIVFAYGDVPERDAVACLANEVSPHDGELTGELKKRIHTGDFSQYQDAKIYASSTTLLEIWKEEKYFKLKERFELQTSEIYYVEVILIRDASSKNIADRLFDLQRRIKKMDTKEARHAIEKIETAIANSMILYDSSIIKWPTVTEGVAKLSYYFGCEQIDELCIRNTQIAEKLVSSLERKERQARDKVTKIFLAIITTFSSIDTIGKVVNAVADKNLRFLIAACIFIFMFMVFEVLKRLLTGSGKKEK